MQIQTIHDDGWTVGVQGVDHVGPIGPVVYGSNYEQAVFKLGILYGSRPQEFSRHLDEIVETPVENI